MNKNKYLHIIITRRQLLIASAALPTLNMKIAKVLEITIPQAILVRATKVIE